MVSEHRLARAGERIIAEYALVDMISEVFPSSDEQERFALALKKLAALGCTVKAGGRRLRDMLGCQVFDFAKDVVWDVRNLTSHQEMRLGPLLEILEKYPTERMVRADLDLFITNASQGLITEIFHKYGFVTSSHDATGGVWVVNIEGGNGTASIVDDTQSWQTKDTWPMYGCTATFDVSNNGFNLNIDYGRMYIYPLEVRFGPKQTLTPEIFASVARSLLWLATATDPDGNWLELPSAYSQRRYLEAIELLPGLLRDIAADPSLEMYYRSSCRDLALALRTILFMEEEEMDLLHFSAERKAFFGAISAYWYDRD